MFGTLFYFTVLEVNGNATKLKQAFLKINLFSTTLQKFMAANTGPELRPLTAVIHITHN